mmetsp:Transcript_11737/g.29556  ORF Transcript_11737/g.29556 Transcript_11737/m.29556 type:complete len:228 (+) Transcript_11737:266-949(+)
MATTSSALTCSDCITSDSGSTMPDTNGSRTGSTMGSNTWKLSLSPLQLAPKYSHALCSGTSCGRARCFWGRNPGRNMFTRPADTARPDSLRSGSILLMVDMYSFQTFKRTDCSCCCTRDFAALAFSSRRAACFCCNSCRHSSCAVTACPSCACALSNCRAASFLRCSRSRYFARTRSSCAFSTRSAALRSTEVGPRPARAPMAHACHRAARSSARETKRHANEGFLF